MNKGTNAVEIAYPGDLPNELGKTTEEFEQELRFLVAAKLYELGHISSGRAAELADMTRVAFLEALGQYHIPVFNYPLEELENEIQEAKRRVRS